jgi:hypothetical protein
MLYLLATGGPERQMKYTNLQEDCYTTACFHHGVYSFAEV